MKKLLSICTSLCFILIFLLITASPAQAADVTASGSCGSAASWTLTSDGHLEVTGTGGIWGAWYEHSSSITSVTISEGITWISIEAFYGCVNLTRVSIPSTMTYIDEYAFQFCDKLSEVHITDLSAWYGIQFITSGSNPLSYGASLVENGVPVTELYIPDDGTVLDRYAFYRCGSLTDIHIPAGFTDIGSDRFYNCKNLTAFHVSPDNPVYASSGGVLFNKDQTTLLMVPPALSGSYTIPDNVVELAQYAFANCHSLQQITIPGTVTIISDSAFYSCDSLTSVIISEGVTDIGSQAFAFCENLTNVSLPESMRTIGSSAFKSCSALTQIYLPDGISVIGNAAFCYCKNLTNIHLPASVTTINSSLFMYCKGLTNITIPKNVTLIEEDAFMDCTNLKAVTLLCPTLTVESSVFSSCSKLKAVFRVGDNLGKVSIGKFNNYLQNAKWHQGCTLEQLGQRECVYCSDCKAYYYLDGTLYAEKPDYYLVGNINGKDYGCESDYENLGEYLFSQGTLTVSFESDSYVFIKTGDNSSWFMSETYCTDSEATLIDTNKGSSEKLFVPGGVTLIFTLSVNDDGSLNLSYQATCTVSGRVTSCGSDSDTLTVDLLQNGNLISSTVCNDGSYSFSDIPVGTYTLRFSKPHHVTLETAITANSDSILSCTIALTGDINTDGKVNAKDWAMLYDYVSETTTLSDYALLCADVTGNGSVTIKDWARLYDHITEANPLW